MLEEIIIYAKYDINGSIIELRSNRFIEDYEGYVQVDKYEPLSSNESEEDRRYVYIHADNGKYIEMVHGKPLFDEKCRPNFHDDFIEWTEEEKEEKYLIVYPEAEEPTEKEKQEKQLNQMMMAFARASFLVEIPDEKAAMIPLCYDPWTTDKAYKVGDRVECDSKLWKCRQAHTSQENWKPSIETASLWEVINVEHAGTLEDPIPYDQTMAVYNGKYYLEEGIKYKCVRDSGQPLYASCASLVGNYFEVVQ